MRLELSTLLGQTTFVFIIDHIFFSQATVIKITTEIKAISGICIDLLLVFRADFWPAYSWVTHTQTMEFFNQTVAINYCKILAAT